MTDNGNMKSQNELEKSAESFSKKLFLLMSISMALFMGAVIVFIL
jgi:hypothetical protein